MTETAFFRLLDVEIEKKGKALHLQVDALNDPSSSEVVDLQQAGETFTADPAEFSKIPKSPFAYWVGDSIRRLFVEMPSVEERGISVQHGASTKRDFRFLRLWWEVDPDCIGTTAEDTYVGKHWVHFAKGGTYSPYYADVHLLVNWRDEAKEIETYVLNRYPYLKGNASWILHPENDYFSPGLTYPRRTDGFSIRVLPRGCIFADKGPTFFLDSGHDLDLMALLGVVNCASFELLVRVQLARTELAQSYEIGLVQSTPFPPLEGRIIETLSMLVKEAYSLQRCGDRGNETTHVFTLPDLVRYRTEPSLQVAEKALQRELEAKSARLTTVQEEINETALDLYGLDKADRALVRSEVEQPVVHSSRAFHASLEDRVQDLLMWCVGVAFGRWDVRKALDPSRLPALGDPFDPLPRCAPGALVGEDGLLLSKEDLSENYPLPIAWDGILVDDPTHPSDIVSRVQGVLDLLWEDRAHAVQREICDILGVGHLRDYFRNQRNGFFSFHAKRYSKSRRHAPIYWLLQSEERHYAIWLYYHRLDTSLLYNAGRGYADAKVELERGRLENLQRGADALEGRDRQRRYREIERQTAVVEDVTAFRDKLDQIALLDLAFDLNDGVLLNIAPLRELVPWKYADRTWKRLEEGKYGWSSMAKLLRKLGLVESGSKS